MVVSELEMCIRDRNYRPFLWDSAERAREALLAALPLADIVKVSEEEMEPVSYTHLFPLVREECVRCRRPHIF